MNGYEVIWTLPAQEELDLIYEYYSLRSEEVAVRLISGILNRAKQLQEFPFSGQEEETLVKLKLGHRFIVEGNYKIIYRLSGSIVYVTDVFDARQNPRKILKK